MKKRLGLTVQFWATARPILGVLQIFGAITTLGLLARLDSTRPAMISLAITTALTAISMFLFGFLRVHDRGE